VDNSGSMQSCDGQRLMQASGRHRMLSCTRWQELADDVQKIAEISAALPCARTDFHLLNPRPGFNSFTVGGDATSWDIVPPRGPRVDLAAVGAALKTSPGGGTPLTEAVERCVIMISPHAAELRARGEQVVVIIATDGLPNNSKSFGTAMRVLQTLPVWVVVRLCTDDESVVSYWNALDEQLEEPLEVLDDLVSEAKEVHHVNPWLRYAPGLHHARLFGLQSKLFDAIDETTLLPSQIKEFIELLFDVPMPEPELYKDEFIKAVRAALATVPTVLNPQNMTSQPWLDLNALERALRPTSPKRDGLCAVM